MGARSRASRLTDARSRRHLAGDVNVSWTPEPPNLAIATPL